MLAGSPQGCIVGPTLFLLYFDDLPDVICSIAIYADDTTLYSKCDQASDLWQQLESASELNLTYKTINWGRNWLVDFNAGKTQLVSFDLSKNTGAIDVNMDRFVPVENHLLKCWDWLSLLNWTRTLALPILLNLPPRKLEPWFVLRSFFLLRLLYISIRPCVEYCCHVWAGAPSCYLELLDKVQKQLAGLLVLYCCLSWTLGSSPKCSQLNSFLLL